jgi:hypothetical protein
MSISGQSYVSESMALSKAVVSCGWKEYMLDQLPAGHVNPA